MRPEAVDAVLAMLPEGIGEDVLAAPPRVERGEWSRIGASRERRPLFGFRAGSGRRRVALVAGAHADEPVGPATLIALATWLGTHRDARELLERATFSICPHVNPDGAAANSSWTSRSSFELEACLRGVVRELPGDDVEFGYPDGDGRPVRPENEAVAAFLDAGAPYDVFASLHGMLIATGAWFLISRDAVSRTSSLRARLSGLCARLGVPLHDVDRRGEKGFHRIEDGFATTPTSIAMREHFATQGDTKTAALFRASSMEYATKLGPSTIALVSEVPLFLIADRGEPGSAPPPRLSFAALRERLGAAQAALVAGDREPLSRLEREVELAPFPRELAARLQLAFVFLAAGLAEPEAFVPGGNRRSTAPPRG